MKRQREIVVRMMGGLGNQLYQYACARYLQSLFPEAKILLDTREYKTYKIRDFEIGHLALKDNVSLYNSTNPYYDISRALYHAARKCSKLIHKTLHKSVDWLLAAGLVYSGHELNMTYRDYPARMYVYGYFQDRKLIDVQRETLLRDFAFADELSEQAVEYHRQIREAQTPCAVSVRCGTDYRDSVHPVCEKAFYRAGLSYLNACGKPSRLFVFADDIDYVKQNGWFSDYDAVYVKGLTPCEALSLMRECTHFVISNSTFSWWGAYMGEAENKKIIAPNRWFTKNNRTRDNRLYTNDMILLDYQTGDAET